MTLAIRSRFRRRETAPAGVGPQPTDQTVAQPADQPATGQPAARQPVAPRPARRPRRMEAAAAGGVVAVTSTLLMVARLIRLVATLVAIVIGVAILLRLVDANATNSVVTGIDDAGKWLVGPFKGMFTIGHHPQGTLALNWGIAAIVYLIAGGLLAALIVRARPRRFARTRTVTA